MASLKKNFRNIVCYPYDFAQVERKLRLEWDNIASYFDSGMIQIFAIETTVKFREKNPNFEILCLDHHQCTNVIVSTSVVVR